MNIETIRDQAKLLAARLELPTQSVIAAITLLDEGNTVPFIARYRKDQTGGIDDQALRNLEHELLELRELEEKRSSTLRLIDEQGLLTEELRQALNAAATKTAIDDIYRPYRPKRRTRASIAREQGLEPLADFLRGEHYNAAEMHQLAQKLVNPEAGVVDADAAIQGAMD
ncbi:MAG: RNA-binding transcriptional accessory protein, partial [Lentisphaerae bacterium]|nr:RNA-binding transcriptional accessory protein [Lentisphaerota bacterium]